MLTSIKNRNRKKEALLRHTGRRAAGSKLKISLRDTLLSVYKVSSTSNLLTESLQDGPKVLQDVSFRVEAGERIGIGK